MATHRLKTVDPYFQRAWDCEKTFEVRNNDRDFQGGDIVYLCEYDPISTAYSGRELRCKIMYILHDFPAIQNGYVVFSIRALDWIDVKKEASA